MNTLILYHLVGSTILLVSAQDKAMRKAQDASILISHVAAG